jgi:hypothetical protein
VCTICWVSSLPFSIFYFHRISFSNVVANFLAVPIGTWILFTALLSILVSPVAGWASIYLNNTNWLLAHVFLGIVNASAAFPGQAMNVGSVAWSTEAKMVILASGRSETVYFCQGSSKGLINPGSPSKYRRITEPFLRSEGVNRLSFLNWTKSDQDHAGSAPALLQHFKVAPTSNGSVSRQRVAEVEGISPGAGLVKTGSGRLAFGEEKLTLNDPTTWNEIRRPPPLHPVLDYQLGSFEVLLLNANRQQITALSGRMVDVVVVPSQRQYSGPELIRKFKPQAILYLQGKPGNRTSAAPDVPIWFLGEKGAVTLVLSNQGLEVSGYLGDRLTLRSRSR